MPGSLIYSPSGSEGGRSVGGGGGTDLDKSLLGVDLTCTPGTTPVKWRRKDSSGGPADGAVDDADVPVNTKTMAAEAGTADRPPPRIMTRRTYLDTGKSKDASGAATYSLNEAARKLKLKTAERSNTPSGQSSTPKRPSVAPSPPRDDNSRSSSSRADDGDSSRTEGSSSRADVISRRADINSRGVTSSSSRPDDSSRADLSITRGDISSQVATNSSSTTKVRPENAKNNHADGILSKKPEETSASSRLADAGAEDGGRGSAAAVMAIDSEGGGSRGNASDKHGRLMDTQGEERDEGEGEGEDEEEEEDACRGDREGGVTVNSRDKKNGTDENGSDKTGSDVGDDNGELPDDERRPPVADEASRLPEPGVADGLDLERSNTDPKEEGGVTSGGQARADVTAGVETRGTGEGIPLGGLTHADAVGVETRGTGRGIPLGGPTEADATGVETQETRGETRGVGGGTPLGGQTQAENAVGVETQRLDTMGAEAEDPEEPSGGRGSLRGQTPAAEDEDRAVETGRLASKGPGADGDDLEDDPVGVGIPLGGAEFAVKARRLGMRGVGVEDPEGGSAGGDGYPESGEEGVGVTDAGADRFATREPQSPPALPRVRRGRATEPRAGEEEEEEEEEEDEDGMLNEGRRSQRRRGSEARDSACVRGASLKGSSPLDRLEDGVRNRSPQRSPFPTPERGRGAWATTVSSPSPPPSPVAVAARAISLEESVRSTARMKKAAEAIALEDEKKAAPVRRVTQRRPPERRVGSSKAGKGEERTRRQQEQDMAEEEERMQALRSRANEMERDREDAEMERDRALELTLEVLKRKHAYKGKGGGGGHGSTPGRKRVHSPPRKSKRPAEHRSSLAKGLKDSAARSCGLSQAQIVLLRRSRELGGGINKPKRRSRQRGDELAQAKEDRPATRTRNPSTEALVKELTRGMTDKEKRQFLHACLADAKECTHRPRTRSAAAAARRGGGRGRGGGGGGEGRGGEEKDEESERDGHGARDAFLYRMDAQERAKNAAMEHRRGELAYKDTLDKRVCPGCGAEQSYDEVQEKRKTCPNCEVEYRKPRTWARVRKEFLHRVEAFEESKRASLQATVKDGEMQIRMLARGRTHDGSDSDGEEGERLLWEDVEVDFMARLRKDARRRQKSLESRSATLGPECTFQPKLSSASERIVGDSAWGGMSFLERVEGDLRRRREEEAYPGGDLGREESRRSFGSYAANARQTDDWFTQYS